MPTTTPTTVEVYPKLNETYPDAAGVPITAVGAKVLESKYIEDALRDGFLLTWDPLEINEPDDRSNLIADAPANAQYIVAAPDPTLTNELVLTQGANITLTPGPGTLTISGSAAGAPLPPSYVTLGSDATLPNERVLTQGAGIVLTDAGAGGALTVKQTGATVGAVDITTSITLDATHVGKLLNISSASSLTITIPAGLPDSSSFTFVRGSTGTVTIATSGAERLYSVLGSAQTSVSIAVTLGAIFVARFASANWSASGNLVVPTPTTASYVTMSADPALTSERVLTPGPGVSFVDGGAGGAVALTQYIPSIGRTGPFTLSLSDAFTLQSYNVAGTDVTVVIPLHATVAYPVGTKIWFSQQTTGGAVILTPEAGVTIPTPPGYARKTAGPGCTICATKNASNLWTLDGLLESTDSFVTMAATTGLPNERVLTQGAGISITDGGPGGAVTISAEGSGDVVGPATAVDERLARFDGVTGKLLQSSVAALTDAGALSGLTGLDVVGSITVSGTVDGVDVSTLGTTVGTKADKAITLTAGAGMTGGGDLSANRTFDVVAHADGSIVVSADSVQVGILATDAQHGTRGGGTLHAAATGAAAGFMTVAQVNALTQAQADIDALELPSYVTLAATGTLTNERVLTQGTGITITDGGAGGPVTISATGGGGDVTGPVSAIDERLARYDGATGKLLQSSTAALTDAGVLSGLTALDVVGSITVTGNVDGVDVSALSASVSGKVTGPGSSTANTVPRYADTTGKLLTTSSVAIDASNNVTGVAGLTATALTVNGSITVTGNVDGVDVSTLSTTVSTLSARPYVTVGADANLSAERALSAGAGSGMTIVDGGPNGAVTPTRNTPYRNVGGAAYSFVLSDAWSSMQFTVQNAVATVPHDSTLNFPLGTEMYVRSTYSGAQSATIAGASGVSVDVKSGLSRTLDGPNARAILHKVAANFWQLNGELAVNPVQADMGDAVTISNVQCTETGNEAYPYALTLTVDGADFSYYGAGLLGCPEGAAWFSADDGYPIDLALAAQVREELRAQGEQRLSQERLAAFAAMAG